ncbi:MAG: hypothetical protein KBF12_13040 [Sebaldella sp.]|nr:hypothetical protein [Sebaldella sp.]
MLGITIVICVFLFMTTALILSTIENKSKINNELLDILENLNERLKILEKKSNSVNNPYFYKEGEDDEKTI